MNEFFRGPAWASAEAQAEWEPRIREAAAAWSELESLTVSERLRSSALFTVTAAEFVEMTAAAAANGLEATALGETFIAASYSAGIPTSGGPGLRAALHAPGLRGAWLEAWRNSDDVALGKLLGFPDCCIDFFKRVWIDERKRDTTLSMAPGRPQLGCILLRWLGVRLVGHLPCGHNCEVTELHAAANAALGRKHELCAGVDAIERLLALPMEYSALHGAGELVTPFFRFMFSTDYTRDRQVFSKPGVVPAPEPPVWRDNGFASAEAMEAAHATIDSVVPADAESILDLGCGDGTLLARLKRSRPEAFCLGLDINAGRVSRGRKRHPEISLEQGLIENQALVGFDVVLFMPGRIREMDRPDVFNLRLRNPDRVRRVVAYAYSDHCPLPLGAIAKASDHAGDWPIVTGPGVEVALVPNQGESRP